MKDKNGTEIKIKDKISIDKDKQPIFEVTGFRGTTTLVKCVDDKGETEVFHDTDTLLIPQSALSNYEITK